MRVSLELDSPVAEVGGAFVGRVSRIPEPGGESSRARAVRMQLRLETEGRGDTDTRTVSELEFPLDDDGRLDAAFRLAVRLDAPISYDGSLLRVRYEVEARVDVKLARDPKLVRPVLVVPAGGLGTYDRPHPLPHHARR